MHHEEHSNGGFAYTTHSFSCSGLSHALNAGSAANALGNVSFPAAYSPRRPAKNLPRYTRLNTRTGKKKPGRQDRQRGDASNAPRALHDRPPPVTTQCTCG